MHNLKLLEKEVREWSPREKILKSPSSMLFHCDDGSVESSNMSSGEFSEGVGGGNILANCYASEAESGQDDVSGEIPGIGIDSDGPIRGCRATGILSGINPPSKLTKSELKGIRRKFHIPCHVSLHVPSSEVRADWNLLGMTCLYELPFKDGFRLPLPRFVTDVCDYYQISPSQLMPNAWRVLLALELFCEINSIEFSRDEVLTAYRLKECNRDVGKYQLHSRFVRTPLIPKLKDCDKRWKDRYFFLPFDSLALPPKSRVSRTWAAASCTGVSFESRNRDLTARRIREFLSYPEDSRWWEAILVDANFRGSNLWQLVPLRKEVEKVCADYVMSQADDDIPLGGDDAIEIFKQKMGANPVAAKGKPAVVKGRVALAIPVSSPVQTRKKRVTIVDHSDWSTDDIRLSFPHSASAYSDFGPQAAEVGKLLWPEDKDRFEDLGPANAIKGGVAHAFQGMQTLLYAGSKVDELCSQVKTLRAEKSALQVENKKLMSQKFEVDKLMAELRVQFNSQVSEVSRLQAEVESLNAKVASEKKRVYMAAMKAEIKLKAKMMEDYQSGKAETWDAVKIFAARDELEQITAASAAIPTEALGGLLVDMLSVGEVREQQQASGEKQD